MAIYQGAEPIYFIKFYGFLEGAFEFSFQQKFVLQQQLTKGSDIKTL